MDPLNQGSRLEATEPVGNPAVPMPPRNNDAALFVGGLSFSATEEDLRDVRVCLTHDGNIGCDLGIFSSGKHSECANSE